MSTGTHSRHRLDEIIRAPIRPSVTATLLDADKVEFKFVRDAVEISDRESDGL
jgi:hypothetical protein